MNTLPSPEVRGDDNTQCVRYPISLKIFGIALGLLALMAVVTSLSEQNLRKVNNEIEALSEYYIPLSHLISKMEVDVRSQIIHLERLVLLQQFQQVDAAALKQEKRSFEEKGQHVDDEVAEALKLIGEASAMARSEADRIELARLDPQIRDVQRAHHHLQDSVLEFLAETRRGNQQAVHVLHEVIISERKNFDAEIQGVRQELQKFTEGAAVKAGSLEREAVRLNWGVTLVAAILGLAFATILTRNMVKPLRRLLDGVGSVERGNLDVQIPVTSADEIGALAGSFNAMVVELRQKERIKETFGKYVDPRIVKGLLEDQQFSMGGEKRLVTVFFSDLEGFTALCERLTPDGVVKFLNQYFTLMSEPIRDCNGIIDKYIGDAIMAFWGPPFTGELDHPALACLAALEQIAKLDEFRRKLPDILGLRKGLPVINVRVGLATGEVTVGNIGSESSRGYTVIGDTVNLASRLETVNKQYGTHLLISEETWRMANDAVETRELDCIRVVGKSEPIRVFELLAKKTQAAPAVLELRDRFEEGLKAYRRCDWGQAEAGFQGCLAINPDDAPSKLFLSRLKHLREHPPAADWDGAWSLSEK